MASAPSRSGLCSASSPARRSSASVALGSSASAVSSRMRCAGVDAFSASWRRSATERSGRVAKAIAPAITTSASAAGPSTSTRSSFCRAHAARRCHAEGPVGVAGCSTFRGGRLSSREGAGRSRSRPANGWAWTDSRAGRGAARSASGPPRREDGADVHPHLLGSGHPGRPTHGLDGGDELVERREAARRILRERGEADELQRQGHRGVELGGRFGLPSGIRFSTSSVLRPVKGRRPQSCS